MGAIVPIVVRLLAVGAVGISALALCSCSAAPTPTAGRPGMPVASAGTTSPSALIIPPVQRNEVARVVFPADANGVSGFLWRIPTAGQYAVKAACDALSPAASLTYVVLDARPTASSESTEQRTIASGQLPCDGQATLSSPTPLVDGPVQVDLRGSLTEVSAAYAVLIPA